MKIKLGQKVTDVLTGLTGVVTALCEYITGCNQVLVQPRCKPDGDFVESRWVDEDRLKVIDPDQFALPRASNGFDKPAPRR